MRLQSFFDYRFFTVLCLVTICLFSGCNNNRSVSGTKDEDTPVPDTVNVIQALKEADSSNDNILKVIISDTCQRLVTFVSGDSLIVRIGASYKVTNSVDTILSMDVSVPTEVSFLTTHDTITINRAIDITINNGADYTTLYTNRIPFNITGLDKSRFKSVKAKMEFAQSFSDIRETDVSVSISKPSFSKEGYYMEHCDSITLMTSQGIRPEIESKLTITLTDTAGNEVSQSIDMYLLIYPNTIYKPVLVDNTYFAPVNCGYDRHHPYGRLYQWGRKDGHGYWNSESAKIIPSNVSGREYYSDNTEYVSLREGALIKLSDIKHNTFYAINPFDEESKITRDWLTKNPKLQNNNLWEASHTQYDPCPEGWRVPEFEELYLLRNYPRLWNNGYSSPDNISGYMIGTYCDKADLDNIHGCLFLPASGFRTANGLSVRRDTTAIYWSSTTDKENVKVIKFDTTSHLMKELSPRSCGCSIRCVADK